MFCYKYIATILIFFVFLGNSSTAQNKTVREITEATFFAGEANIGFYLPSADGEVRITRDIVSIMKGGIFIRDINSSKFSLNIVISNSSGILSIHFPFRGEMIKLFIHRPFGHDGGSPSVGKVGDKFPLSGWSIAHKVPVQLTDTLTFTLSVSEDSFEYQYHLQPKKVEGWAYPSHLIQHKHETNSAYFPDLPNGLKNLKNAILLEAGQSTIKRFRLQLLSSYEKREPIANSIMVIFPYRHGGTWVFDDSRTGLVQEPFVSGIPQMIDHLVKGIPDAGKGFRLLFSPSPFPGYTMKLILRRAEGGGNWYYSEELNMEGWLCPALFKYFKNAPQEIYINAERKQ